MGAMAAFAMLMGILFGGMMLALVAGYLSAEKQRSLENGPSRAREAVSRRVAEVPRFFAEPGDARAVLVSSSRDDDEFVGQLEGYLRAEQALVARFVREPSIDNLYRQAPASPLLQ